MNQLQATPDFDDKVSKLEGFASWPTLNNETATSYIWFWRQSLQIERVCQPADHQLWSSYKLHLILATNSQNWKGQPAGRLTINYEPATSYTWFWRQSLQIERVCQQADHQLWTCYKLHLISWTKCKIWKGQPADHQFWASYKLHLILMTKSQNWKGLPAGQPSIMNQLQATPDFINKVSNLKGSASRPADHQLWASWKLHLILTTNSPNRKGLQAGWPSIMKQLQATPDFNDKVSKLERSAGRPTLNYEPATSYTWF